MARGSTFCLLWLHVTFVVVAAQDDVTVSLDAAGSGLDLLQRLANLKAGNIDVHDDSSEEALPSMSLPECHIFVQNRVACGSAGITGDECERRGYCWAGDAMRRADNHPRCFCPSEEIAELAVSRRAIEKSATPNAVTLLGQSHHESYLLRLQYEGPDKDICQILPISVANVTAKAKWYADAFTRVNQTDNGDAHKAGSAADNWAWTVTELSKAWANFAYAENCPDIIVSISEAGKAISEAWADSLMSFRVPSGDGPGVFLFGAPVNTGNQFSWMFTEIAKDWGQVAGTAGNLCASVPSWAAKFEQVTTALSGHVDAWTDLMETLGTAMRSQEKAGLVNSFPSAFQQSFAAFADANTIWAQSCQSSALPAEVEAASKSVVSAMGQFAISMKTGSTASAEAYRPCTSDVCWSAASSSAGAWAWVANPMGMSQASLEWVIVVSALSGEVFSDTLKAWTDFFVLLGVEGPAAGLAWSEIVRLADIHPDSCGTLSSTANFWAYHASVMGEALHIAGQEWSTLTSQVDSSRAWSEVFKKAIGAINNLSKAFGDTFEGANTEQTLSCSASSSNTWVDALIKFSKSLRTLAVDHADNMDDSEDPPLYLEASDIWVDALQSTIDVGEETSLHWLKAFVRPVEETLVSRGTIQSASDNFAYMHKMIASRTNHSGAAWVCIFCTSGWTEAMDDLLNLTNKTSAGSPAHAWTTLSAQSIGSWDYAASQTLKGRLHLSEF